MSKSAPQPPNLAKLLRQFRQHHRLSRNRLAQLTGISRRTLARIESGHYSSHEPRTCPEQGRRAAGRWSRTAMRLARLLLTPDQLQRLLDACARPPGPGSSPPPLSDTLRDLFGDLYPAFLFHYAPHKHRAQFAERHAPDYAPAFFRLILLPEHNLTRRLRAFRLQHDLTLKETAHLLDLSTSQLHRLERGQRQPSPRTRFRILRLLTLPLPASSLSAEHENSRRATRQRRLELLKLFLALPPPPPLEFSDDPDLLHRLRYHWLTTRRSTHQLARALGISQPHLIRLLRGDRRPSRALRQHIARLVPLLSDD